MGILPIKVMAGLAGCCDTRLDIFFFSTFSRQWDHGVLPLVALLNYFFIFFWDDLMSVGTAGPDSGPSIGPTPDHQLSKRPRSRSRSAGAIPYAQSAVLRTRDDPDMEFRYCSSATATTATA